MKLPDKIIKLRKENGLSQEKLAEKLDVSRQAISRWENGTALPDAQNILQISKLFNVTTDYLLNDEYVSDKDIPLVKEATKEIEDVCIKKKKLHLILAIVFSAIAIILMISLICVVKNFVLFILLCFGVGFCGTYAGLQFGLYFRKKHH